MKKKTHVKRHKRNGVIVDAHDREVDFNKRDKLAEKILDEKSEKSCKETLNKLLY